MIIGDTTTLWANVFRSGGLWHFTIHRHGETFVVYGSRFVDGHAERSSAISHAEDLLKTFAAPSAVV
jgi:hypothetical protein